MQADESAYLYTVLESRSDQIVRLVQNTGNPGVQAWLGGVPVQHQGRYSLKKGSYTLLIRLKAGEKPQSEDLCADLHFMPAAPTAAGDRQAWQQQLRWARP